MIGDIIQDGDKIYGDGVNIAARIESLADPGGICISGTAYDQVKRKINIKYDYLDIHKVRNIDEPVRVYRVLMEFIPDGFLQKEKSKRQVFIKRKASAHSGKPSIAVLPFVNLSSDPEQEYFVDGLSEEILNSLTQIPDLIVIARTSSFSFKGTKKTIQEIAGVLGVKNVLEGSVRKAGISLRITAQLVKADDSSHLWAKTYDRELKDIFTVQEDIATNVADELKVTLGIGKSFKHVGGTDNLEAYELYLIAKGHFYGYSQNANVNVGMESIDAAIALDPKFALGWALKGMGHVGLAFFSSDDRASLEFDAALEAALRAIELDPILGKAYLLLETVHSARGEFIQAELNYRKGMALTNESIDYFEYGLISLYNQVGYLKKCKELIKELVISNPLQQLLRWMYISILGHLGDMELAEEEYESGKTIFGGPWHNSFLFIALLRLGSKEVLSINDLPESPEGSYPIYEIFREHLESPEEGLAELGRIYDSDDNLSRFDFISIAKFAAHFGDQEFALKAIKRSVNLLNTTLYDIWAPVFRKVRQLPRFKEFLKEIGLVDYWKEYGWPDLCHSVGDDDFECD